MNTAQRLTPRERDRALGRVRALTNGVAIAGASATIGLAWLAAVSNPGTSAVASTQTTDASTSTSTSSSNSDGASSSSTSSTGTSGSSSSSLGSTSVSGSTSSGGAHATGGGS